MSTMHSLLEKHGRLQRIVVLSFVHLGKPDGKGEVDHK